MDTDHVRTARPRNPADPFYMTVLELQRAYLAGALRPTALVADLLDRIDVFEPLLNAFITVTAALAMEQAREAERRLAASGAAALQKWPLLGIPVTIKDNFDLAGVRTTAGSAILRTHVAERSAPAVEAWVRAGAVVLGKTNLHEFAWGVTTENPHFGAAHNPWDPGRSPGGSSGGAAAALAAGIGVLALGSDTGGSVRIPAALCGLVGLKATNGAVSQEGLVPLAESLDCPGVLARTAEDAAAGWRVWAAAAAGAAAAGVMAPSTPAVGAADPGATDPGPAAPGVGLPSDGEPCARLRIGVPRHPWWDGIPAGIAEPLEEALRWLQGEGQCVVEEVAPSLLADAMDAQAVVARWEAAAYHRAWMAERPQDYGPDVAARIRGGLAETEAAYRVALDRRRAFVAETQAAFGRFDLLATPATLATAPRLGTYLRRESGEHGIHWRYDAARDADVRRLLLGCTGPWNLVGAPAIIVPAGLTTDGLPVGLQLAAPWHAEERLLAVAARWERAHPVLLPMLD